MAPCLLPKISGVKVTPLRNISGVIWTILAYLRTLETYLASCLVGGVVNLFSFDQVWWPRGRAFDAKNCFEFKSLAFAWPSPPPLQINIDSCIIQCYPSVAARTVTTALIYLLFNISSIKLLMCIEASTTYRTGGWSRRIFTRGQTVTAESEFEREKNYQFPQKKGYTT